MQQTWLEDPQERPDFHAIVLHLANLMKYEGDIKSDLKMETKNCSKLRVKPYQQVELSSSQGNAPSLAHVYSVLEQPEPVYSNYSREESVDSFEPEEYEIPAQCIQDNETTESLSNTPMEYEIPQSTAERRKKNRKATPEQGSPHHTNNPTASPPVPARKNHVIDDDEIHYEVPQTYTDEDTVPARYSRLSYPAIKKAVSAPDPETRYESAPLNGELEPNNYNSLPSKFHQKNHVYRTLEPNF